MFPGNHQDIIDKACHIGRLLLNPPGKIHFHGLILDHPALQQFRISLDRGNGGLQLMGCIAEKFLAYLFFPVDLAQILLHILGHISDGLGNDIDLRGMEFSRVASLRGHRVVIWEEGPCCGGQLRLAAVPPARHDFDYLADYLQSACTKAGVRFCFNTRTDAQSVFRAVKEQGFDHVVTATGARPVRPGVPSEEGAHIVQAWDVLKKHADTGSDVVVVGGGAVGIETAILLGEEGTLTPEALRGHKYVLRP